MAPLNSELQSNVLPDVDPKTPIQEFYAGQSVLITGGTGFLGKLLIEKLLRSCPDLTSIYLVIRTKKNQNATQRLDALFDDPIFNLLKKKVPKFRHKVTSVAGDCSLPGLGISASDRELIQREVSVVFNVAATVRFDERIKHAVAVNVSSAKEVLDMCQSIKNLKVVIHVSTAYSNCNRLDIDEKFYEPPLTGDNAIRLVNTLDDKKLDDVTQTLLGDFPNTYAFTKCIAEQVVQQYGRDLPAGIFRPAIVISTYREPAIGWVDNVYGPTGALVGGGAGLIRTMNIDENCTAELIPADLTVNALIATAWEVANKKVKGEDPPIYNYHSSWSKGITWGEYINLAFKYGKKAPSIRSIWCYTITTTKNTYLYYLLALFLHIIPAFFMDAGLFLTGRETKILKLYKKIHKFSAVTTYFSKRKWDFKNANTTTLWEKLTPEDKDIFYFSMKDFDWEDFMQKCVHGLRLYIFKDDPNNVPMARKRMARMLVLHKLIKYIFFGLCLWFLYLTISAVMSSVVGSGIGVALVSKGVSIR